VIGLIFFAFGFSCQSVTTPTSAEDIPSPPAVEGEVVEGCPAVVCALSPPVASVEPAALGQVLTPPHRQARLAGRARRGCTHPRLLKPRRRLPALKPSRRRLDRCCPCSLRPLHGGASSPAAPGRHFGVLGGLLQLAQGAVVEVLCCRDRHREFPPLELSSCRWSCSPEGSRPQPAHCHARRFPLYQGLLPLLVGRPRVPQVVRFGFCLGHTGDALVSPCYAAGWLSSYFVVSYLCYVVSVNSASS
jgi:hypothetical protein